MWKHSLGSATVARLLAKSIPKVLPEDAFLAGILHDVGKLMLYDVVPDEYLDLAASYPSDELVIEEQSVFGISHEGIGLKSAHSWGLPEEIKAAIGYHHHPIDSPVHFEVAAVIHAANRLAKIWGIGSEAATDSDLPKQIIEHLAINDESLMRLREQSLEVFENIRSWAA